MLNTECSIVINAWLDLKLGAINGLVFVVNFVMCTLHTHYSKGLFHSCKRTKSTNYVNIQIEILYVVLYLYIIFQFIRSFTHSFEQKLLWVCLDLGHIGLCTSRILWLAWHLLKSTTHTFVQVGSIVAKSLSSARCLGFLQTTI